MTTNLITELAQKAAEEGTYAVTVSYFDEAGAAVTPNTAAWTLTDTSGVVINERADETIVTPATSNVIVLSGDDLIIGSHGVKRHLLITGTYDSSLGDDLPFRAQVNFEIEDFSGVS
jgi:hypothetical protein